MLRFGQALVAGRPESHPQAGPPMPKPSVAHTGDHVAIERLTQVFHRDDRSLTALSDVNLRVRHGEFLSVIGPSGCGKSTLLRLIGGLLRPTQGRVDLAGATPAEAQRRKAIGYVFQDPSLLPWRTVIANVNLPLEVNRQGRAEDHRRDPRDLLHLVGLSQFEGYYPRELSGGMQQRVALARALVFEPPLLLMDEPFGALDEITRRAMRYELLRIWQAGNGASGRKTVVFVTHSIAEAIALSDRVVVMSRSPGTVRAVIDIDLPRPRDEDMEIQPAFLDYAVRLRRLLEEG
jgi:NitT/TauT family transport system ATP-binding protein